MSNHYAFIVGVNQEWPEERCDLGDIGLARCLRDHCKLPQDNLVEVYDEIATRSNILIALERLLDHRNENLTKNDVLLFYYGGHGKRTAFCTQKHCVVGGRLHTEPWIKHLEIINLFENKFKGGTVLCIIDTCHSGGFGEAVFQRYIDNNNSLNVNYGCLMSVPPADTAGMEWSMSEAFIRAFKGEFLCSPPGDHGGGCYYLSTKKGKHPIKSTISLSITLPNTEDSADNKQNSIIPTWGQVLEYLSDEMGRIKGDRLTTLFLGKGMEDGKFLQQPCVFGGDGYTTSDISTFATASIQRDETWMDNFRRECHTINDGVYVKWAGDCSDMYAPHKIGWFPGRIISIGSTMQIELFDVITKLHWTVTLPFIPSTSNSGRKLLAGLPFKFGFEPQSCVNVVTRMAKSLGYFDTSLPRGTRVKVLWEEDGEYYKATTMSRDELIWKDVDLDSEIKMIGPCVPIRWDEDDSISFVPTAACSVKKTDSNRPEKSKSSKKEMVSLAEKSMIDEANISTPLEAMMASLACQGKTLQGDSPILEGLATEEDVNSWEAYDAESCTWESVQLMNKVHQSILPLTVLAYHMCYPSSETYSVVFWRSDSSLSIVPNSFLRQKPTNNDGDDGSSSSSSSSEDEDCGKTKEHEEVRKYIETACYMPINNELETNLDIQRMLLS